MRKFILAFLLLSSFSFSVNAQCAHKHSTLDDRIDMSELIVEGTIIAQESFKSDRYGIIYTKQVVDVYKVLKGSLRTETIEILTTGGRVGNEILNVFPTLKLKKSETGIFFLRNDRRKLPEVSDTWQAVAIQRSFIKYNPELTKASDMDETFAELDHLYEVIAEKSGTIYTDVKPLPILSQSRSVLTPVISSFSPLSRKAGKSEMITITGTDFGTTPGYVYFKDADTGGTTETLIEPDAADWTDTQIIVRVPSEAGKGKIRVRTSTNDFSGESADELTVEYSLSNVYNPISGNDELKYLVDNLADGDGGYKLKYGTSTLNNGVAFNSVPGAMDAFERAMGTWQTETAVPLFAGADCGTSAIGAPSSDGESIVMFDNDAYDLDTEFSSTTLAVTFTRTVLFSPLTQQEVYDIDIVFRRDGVTGGGSPPGYVDWYYGTGDPAITETDFESVALHELGHSNSVGHIIDATQSMHFEITTGDKRRTLGTSDISGGTDVVTYSAAYVPPNLPFPVANFPNDRQMMVYALVNDCGAPAPVELGDFKGELIDNKVELDWYTNVEIENDYFTLERSADGVDFEVIARIDGKGNSNTPVVYSYTDAKPLPGISYYRLSQTDYNGELSLHNKLVPINNRKIIEIKVNPNPIVNDFISVEYYAVHSGNINISVRNLAGASVMEGQYEVDRGRNDINVQAFELPAGIYYLRAEQDQNSRVIKFVKLRY